MRKNINTLAEHTSLIRRILIMILCFLILVPNFCLTTLKVKAEKDDVIVYINLKGSVYHTMNCRYLNEECYYIKLKDLDTSFDPCSVCDAPARTNTYKPNNESSSTPQTDSFITKVLISFVSSFLVWAIWFGIAAYKKNKKQQITSSIFCASYFLLSLFNVLLGVFLSSIIALISYFATKDQFNKATPQTPNNANNLEDEKQLSPIEIIKKRFANSTAPNSVRYSDFKKDIIDLLNQNYSTDNDVNFSEFIYWYELVIEFALNFFNKDTPKNRTEYFCKTSMDILECSKSLQANDKTDVVFLFQILKQHIIKDFQLVNVVIDDNDIEEKFSSFMQKKTFNKAINEYIKTICSEVDITCTEEQLLKIRIRIHMYIEKLNSVKFINNFNELNAEQKQDIKFLVFSLIGN